MKINVLDEAGKKTSKTIDLSDGIFKIEPHDHSIWLDIRSIRANQRQGTHDTKGRSEASGGGRKPFRQKGTGRARQGTIRAPQYKGGGRAFGPHPRAHTVGINKKIKKLARKSALTYKIKTENLLVVEDFSYDKPETGRISQFLQALELSDKKVLLLTGKNEKNIYLSARNIYNLDIRESTTFSTYDVLKAEKLVVQETAAKKINEVLA